MAKAKLNEADVAGLKAMANLSGGRSASGKKASNAGSIGGQGGRIDQMRQSLSKDGDDRRGKKRAGQYAYGQGHDRGEGI
jgi:hypothetical protein